MVEKVVLMAIDKNQAVIDYLLTCPSIAENPVFFNAIQAKDMTKEIVTIGNDTATNTPFIDGSVQKRYTFTIIDFRSITYNPLVTVPGYTNENVEDMLDVQGVIDWIEEQNVSRNFPDFGEGYLIDSIGTGTDNPNLDGVDTNITPALAKYSISVQIDYLDVSKAI